MSAPLVPSGSCGLKPPKKRHAVLLRILNDTRLTAAQVEALTALLQSVAKTSHEWQSIFKIPMTQDGVRRRCIVTSPMSFVCQPSTIQRVRDVVAREYQHPGLGQGHTRNIKLQPADGAARANCRSVALIYSI